MTDKVIEAAGEMPFLSAREAVDGFNTLNAYWERVFQIAADQARFAMEDGMTTVAAIAKSASPLDVAREHVARRAEHIGMGVQQMLEVNRDVGERLVDWHRVLWSPWAATRESGAPDSVDADAILARLHRDHGRMDQVAGFLERSATPGAELPAGTMDVLASAADYVAEYPDTIHHPLEDRIFDLVRALCGDAPEIVSVLDATASAHVALTSATEKLRAVLDPAASEMSEPLAEAIRGYVALQREHMRFEEEQLFPIAADYLHRIPLADLEEALGFSEDSLFDHRLPRYDDLYRHVTGQL